MTTATKVSANEPSTVEIEYYDETMKLNIKTGAEVFKSGNGLATSVAAIAMVLAYF